jgi:hypothetical protein
MMGIKIGINTQEAAACCCYDYTLDWNEMMIVVSRGVCHLTG